MDGFGGSAGHFCANRVSQFRYSLKTSNLRQITSLRSVTRAACLQIPVKPPLCATMTDSRSSITGMTNCNPYTVMIPLRLCIRASRM